MGYNLQWLAVENKNFKSVLKKIRLKSSHQYEELPESDFNAIKINEWQLISNNFVNYFDLITDGDDGSTIVKERSLVEKYFTDKMMKTLSKNCQVIRLDASEYKMWSKVDFWENGKNIWSISHNGEDNVEHLNIEGNPPAILENIISICKKKQVDNKNSGVDFTYEIPIELAEKIVGYRHDEDIDGNEEQWEILVQENDCNHMRRFFQVAGTCFFFFYLIKYCYLMLYNK